MKKNQKTTLTNNLNIKESFRKIDWKLFFTIFLSSLIPSFYSLVRIFIIGTLEQGNKYSIASQLMWVNLLYEIIQEFLILPLFFALSWNPNRIDKETDLSNKLKSGLIITIGLYLILAIIIMSFTKQLCLVMNVKPEDLQQTIEYVRFEAIAFLFSIVVTFAMTFLEYQEKKFFLITLAISRLLLFIFFDIFLLSPLSFSANLGIIGIPVSNIVVNLIIFGLTITFLWMSKVKLFSKGISFWWVITWLKKGCLTGLESLIRNLVFTFMVVRIANMVTDNGVYWMANNFIWQWLLLPTLSLGKLVQIELSNSMKEFKIKTIGYFSLAIIFIGLWLLSIPLWYPFTEYVLNFKDYKTLIYICLIQTPFYFTFIFNTIMDSTFLAKGKINYLVVQSIIVNIIYYSIAFALFQTGVIKPSILSLSLMFGIGMAIDLIPTTIQYVIFIKKIKKEWIYLIPFSKLEKPLTNGRSNYQVSKLFDKVYKTNTDISIESNNFLNFLENNDFNYSQRYLGKDQKNRNVYEFIVGKTFKEFGDNSQEQLLKFIDVIKLFHELSLKYKNENKYWCHNDLSPLNVVFKEDGSCSIIDWDKLSQSERINDICYVLWTWINIGNPNKSDEQKINELSEAINYWNLSIDEIYNLKNSFISRIQKEMESKKLNNQYYQSAIEYGEYSKKWINENWSSIQEKIIK